MVRVLIFAALLFAGSGAAVTAETAPGEAAKGMVGSWEISNVDRDRRCTLTFTVDRVPRGYRLELETACAEAFPSLGTAVAWNFGANDKLHFYSAKGASVLAFAEVEGGLFESERGPDGLLFLQAQAALKIENRTAEQIFGD